MIFDPRFLKAAATASAAFLMALFSASPHGLKSSSIFGVPNFTVALTFGRPNSDTPAVK